MSLHFTPHSLHTSPPTHLERSSIPDLSNGLLSSDEQAAQSFVRMCRCYEFGERIFFHSSQYDADAVEQGATLLKQTGIVVQTVPVVRNRNTQHNFDSCVILSQRTQDTAVHHGVPGYLACATPNRSQFRQ